MQIIKEMKSAGMSTADIAFEFAALGAFVVFVLLCAVFV